VTSREVSLRESRSKNAEGRNRLDRIWKKPLWLELFVDGNIVAPEKLSGLQQKRDKLTAIFVRILKRSKESFPNSSFILRPSALP